MKLLSNMTIGKKLAAIFGGGVLMVICIAGVAIWALHAVNEADNQKFEGKQTQALANAVDADRLEIGQAIAMAVDSESGLDEYLAVVAQHRKEYQEGFKQMLALATDDDDRRLLSELESAMAGYRDVNQKIVDLLKAGKRKEAAMLQENGGKRENATRGRSDRQVPGDGGPGYGENQS